MPADGPLWPWQAHVHQTCLTSPSGKLYSKGRTDECQQAPVLHFLLNSHLFSAIGSPSKKTKCPWLPSVLIQAHMVGVWAAFLTCTPDGRVPQFLLWRSGIPQAGQQVHPPQGLALGHHTGNHSKSTFLFLSALIQWHEQTSFEG